MSWSTLADAQGYKVYKDGVVQETVVVPYSYIDAGDSYTHNYQVAAVGRNGLDGPMTAPFAFVASP